MEFFTALLEFVVLYLLQPIFDGIVSAITGIFSGGGEEDLF